MIPNLYGQSELSLEILTSIVLRIQFQVFRTGAFKHFGEMAHQIYAKVDLSIYLTLADFYQQSLDLL